MIATSESRCRHVAVVVIHAYHGYTTQRFIAAPNGKVASTATDCCIPTHLLLLNNYFYYHHLRLPSSRECLDFGFLGSMGNHCSTLPLSPESYVGTPQINPKEALTATLVERIQYQYTIQHNTPAVSRHSAMQHPNPQHKRYDRFDDMIKE